MEQHKFENNEKGPKRQFIVINYNDPEPLFAGEATSEEEAAALAESEAGIIIDYNKNPEVAIAFLTPGQESDDEDRLVA